MQTKLFKTLAATAMSVLAIACAKEPVADNGQQAGVSFMVEVPGASVTKAYGEAEKATKLYYQVFDNAGASIEGLGVQTTDLVGKAAKVSFQLVKDQTYNFVFWAQTTETGYYTIDETEGLKKITANYTNKLANDENFDAFYAVKKIKISGPVSESVELTRPFAQINIATKGVLKAGETEMKIDFTGATSSVTIEEVPTEFFPLSPAASQFGSETVTARFKTADAPSGNMTIDNNAYKYLALNYVFAPTDGTVYDITAKLSVDGKTVNLNVPAAPAKRNWRTNILGNLLTSSADINVIVTPGFDENGNEDIDLSNIKTETELKAALATYGAATISNEVALTSSLSTTGDKTLTIESNGLIAPASDMRKDISEIIYVSGGTLTLDGDGKIIGQSNGTYSYGSEAITVAGGTLNIKGNLKVAAGSGSVKSDRAVYVRKGTLNIYGGYFSTSDDASGNPNPVVFLKPDFNKQAYCNIYGGVFESTGNSEYVVNIEDTERSRAHIKIYGGKFKGFDPGNVNEGTITSFLAEGYKSTKVGDYYVVTKEDVTPVVSNEGLNTAFNEAANAGKEITVNLSEGTFNWPDSKDGNNVKFPKTINVVGTSKEDCFVKFSAGSYPEDSDVIFENVTIDNAVGCAYNEGSLAQMVRVKDVTVKNCIIKNQFRILAKGIVNIKNCQFINTNSSGFDGYCLNYYGYDGSTVNVENCTFDTVQKAIVIYSEGHVTNYTLNVKDCKFTASDSSTDKAAVQMHTEFGIHGNVTINNCTATGFKANTLSPEGLWWEGKNNVEPKVPTKNFTIKVGGTTVQTAE